MNLEALLKKIEIPFSIARQGSPDISGIAYDSRKVGRGDLFVAVPGAKEDGIVYAEHAIRNGACAVAARTFPDMVADDTAVILTENPRRFLSAASAVWWDYPDRSMHMVGVTGTNGKTTSAKLIKWLWEMGGFKSGLLGTINNMSGGRIIPSTHTTPESRELFEILSLMKDEGCKRAVMEVSSHALVQGRVDDISFDGIVFTNLTQDHLDYHGDFESYKQGKIKLFRMMKPDLSKTKYAVINLDDPSSPDFLAACAVDAWTYGTDAHARIRIKDRVRDAQGSRFSIEYAGGTYKFRTPLIGGFNISNTCNMIAVGLAEGLSADLIEEAVRHSPQTPGRFERIDEGQDYSVVVDYAHSPDGLMNVLAASRELSPRRLITVFGCGGDRDRTKRPIMGGIAADLSDYVFITSDNPRTEEPLAIIEQIKQGIRGGDKNYIIEPDRKKAIGEAIAMAGEGDMVLIAGKGHEDYQIIGQNRIPFDDRRVARDFIINRSGS